MKNITKITIAVTALLLSVNISVAQESYIHCGTNEAMKKIFDEHPEMYQQFLQDEIRLAAEDKAAAANNYKDQEKVAATIYTIPIVFHVIEQGGTENISDAQIYDEVRILNNDYRKLNSDTTAIVPSFRTIAADIQIQFRLAQKDPNGNCTNGIDRVYSSLTNNADDNSKLNDWPRNKYLNVWTVKTISSSGVAGYAYLPQGAVSAVDGVIILSSYIGSIGTGSVGTSRALTHEIGHFLNLQHTWGNTNNPGVACGDDNVTDTPHTMGHTSCLLTDAVCVPPTIENVQNYMEYAYCSNMFTAGQRTRMRSALTSNTAQRSSLWTTANLAATGVSTPAVLCQADFETNNTNNIICAGNSIQFTDISWNGNPTSWSWTFPGGTPATSTDSTPVVTYNTAGVYNVSLSVSNQSGTVSATKNSYIRVNPSSAMFTGSIYSEGFETGGAIPNANWQVINGQSLGSAWAQTSTAAATGTKSAMLTNVAADDGYLDELIGPSINMDSISLTSPQLTFKVAYAQRSTTTNDLLKVYVSTNCGIGWIQRYASLGSSLATAPVNTGNFVPTASQWVTKTISLNNYTTATNLFFKFQFTSNGGNNIYIDDINIAGQPIGAGIDEFANNLDFNVFPNPADENTIIRFNLIEKEKVTIKIMDVVGREIAAIANGELNSGMHQYSVADNTQLSSGVYFVTLTAGSRSFTKKLIVK